MASITHRTCQIYIQFRRFIQQKNDFCMRINKTEIISGIKTEWFKVAWPHATNLNVQNTLVQQASLIKCKFSRARTFAKSFNTDPGNKSV